MNTWAWIVLVWLAALSLLVVVLAAGHWLARRKFDKNERMSDEWLQRQARLARTNGGKTG